MRIFLSPPVASLCPAMTRGETPRLSPLFARLFITAQILIDVGERDGSTHVRVGCRTGSRCAAAAVDLSRFHWNTSPDNSLLGASQRRKLLPARSAPLELIRQLLPPRRRRLYSPRNVRLQNRFPPVATTRSRQGRSSSRLSRRSLRRRWMVNGAGILHPQLSGHAESQIPRSANVNTTILGTDPFINSSPYRALPERDHQPSKFPRGASLL
jgi:hypothetical protein